MKRSIPAYVFLSLTVAALGVFASGSWRDIEFGQPRASMVEPPQQTVTNTQAEPLSIPTESQPTTPPTFDLPAPLDLDDARVATVTEPVCVVAEDAEVCDPDVRIPLAAPPEGAVLGEPTLAPPRPTPIHPVASRFDVPERYTETIEVEIDLTVNTAGS